MKEIAIKIILQWIIKNLSNKKNNALTEEYLRLIIAAYGKDYDSTMQAGHLIAEDIENKIKLNKASKWELSWYQENYKPYIKPCPFCGSKRPYASRSGEPEHTDGVVECCDCGAHGPYSRIAEDDKEIEADAIRVWNTRI